MIDVEVRLTIALSAEDTRLRNVPVVPNCLVERRLAGCALSEKDEQVLHK